MASKTQNKDKETEMKEKNTIDETGVLEPEVIEPEILASSNPKITISKFQRAEDDIKILIRARYPIIYVLSDEKEKNVLQIVYDICRKGTTSNKYQKKLFLWDISRGIVEQTVDGPQIEYKSVSDQADDPINALDFIIAQNKDIDAIYVLCEFHHYLPDPNVQRKLRLFSEHTTNSEKKILILLSTKNDGMPNSGKAIPSELENIVHIYEWPYPDGLHIEKTLKDNIIPTLNHRFKEANPPIPQMNFVEKDMKKLVNACKGMTVYQIENATTKCAIVHKTLIPQTISLEKKQIIQRSGLCDYVEPDQKLSDIGGLANLKRWLKNRQNILSDEAFDFGCDLPNGVLMIGPWGSGKSSAAKAVIHEWGLPGIRIDAAKIYNMYVGDSEQRTRKILKLAESISPCVLWFDEVENLLAGGDSGVSDGGTSSRVIGIISTWMSEHEGMVFCIFTANDISKNPPKLFRKGRLDEIFIVDLPVSEEREEIYKIHIKKRLEKQNRLHLLDKIDTVTIAAKSYNFSGAEIEAAVNAAVIQCFNDGQRDLETKDILKAVKDTIPLSCTMREKITHLREWQKGRAVLASDFQPEEIKDIKEFVSVASGQHIEL